MSELKHILLLKIKGMFMVGTTVICLHDIQYMARYHDPATQLDYNGITTSKLTPTPRLSNTHTHRHLPPPIITPWGGTICCKRHIHKRKKRVAR